MKITLIFLASFNFMLGFALGGLLDWKTDGLLIATAGGFAITASIVLAYHCLLVYVLCYRYSKLDRELKGMRILVLVGIPSLPHTWPTNPQHDYDFVKEVSEKDRNQLTNTEKKRISAIYKRYKFFIEHGEI